MMPMDSAWFYVKCLATSLVVISTLNQVQYSWDTTICSHDGTSLSSVSNHSRQSLQVKIPSWRLLLESGTIFPNKTWKPVNGCKILDYSSRDVRKCLDDRARVAPDEMDLWFFGDSRMRYLYFGLLQRFWDKQVSGKQQRDMHNEVKEPHFNVNLFWDTRLIEKAERELEALLTTHTVHRPGFVLLSVGMWYLQNLRDGRPFHKVSIRYNETLHHLLPLLNRVAAETHVKVIWVMQDPLYDELIPEGWKKGRFTNEHLIHFNALAESALSGSNVLLWRSARELSLAIGDHLFQSDGVHVGQKTLWAKANLLLNVYCQHTDYLMQASCTVEMCQSAQNMACTPETCRDVLSHAQGDKMQAENARTNSSWEESTKMTNRTCIPQRVPEACSLAQLLTVGLFFVLALYWFVCSVVEQQQLEGKGQSASHYREAAAACGSFGLILVYFLLCDRFNYFPVEEKHFHWAYFAIPLLVMLGIGIWYNAPSESDDLLNRNHTDEWKGWMQLVILVYHYTGASQNLDIYCHLRVIVSSYLFLSGYGHFCYYYRKQDFGVFRFAQVIFRMNFLTVTLCMVMARPYQFYYFVPLVTYWYIVVYVTMAVFAPKNLPESEDDPTKKVSVCRPNLWLCAKFFLIFIAVTGIWLSRSSFDIVFGTYLWRWLFATSDNSLHEWYFRWSLDRYSTLYGVAAAACIYSAKKSKRLSKHEGRCLYAVLATAAFVAIESYEIFQRRFSEKPIYNSHHPVVTIVPIVSFIIIRHTVSMATNRYSYIFAAVGRISLELFIAQYHIWLADDTHKTLVLVPGYPAINICVTTIVFVAVAHHIHHVTSTLAEVLIPKDKKVLIRNVICTAIIIGIYVAL